MSSLKHQAEQYLRLALNNPTATFRDGQWEAIRALVEDRVQLLVVQRTGWGKSMIYFLATRLLRDRDAGPTLLISPLLALMRNQIEAAERIGIGAVTINSANRDEWTAVEALLGNDEVDILLISPERLSNQPFRQNVLATLAHRVGLFVVDEAHCISDWGHDFRPDYRRIVRILQALPPNVPVLATTATANDRVVKDVVEQIGEGLRVIRGPLARKSLRLQAIYLPSHAERLAWLAEQLPSLQGSGIIYARTIRDAERVAEWLRTRGIDAYAYHSGAASREQLEQDLLSNSIKALVATSALGMGFDKPDLAFVIHYQRPGSVVEYYQQVGRAGRNDEAAYGIMLSGTEDDEITDYFIRTAFPPLEHIQAVLDVLEEAEEGLKLTQIQARLNLRAGKIEKVLKRLDVLSPAPIVKQGSQWYRTANAYTPDLRHMEKLTKIRRAEQEELRRYMEGDQCHMAYLRAALDDGDIQPCGRCAACEGRPLLPITVGDQAVQQAIHFLKRSYQLIEPRKRSPASKVIPEPLQAEPGRALCIYGDAGWGMLVKRGKHQDGSFSDQLIEATAEMILRHWRPDPMPSWVTGVPSLRHPELVSSFARRLARQLGLPFVEAIDKVRATAPQKDQRNSHYRLENLRHAFVVNIPDPQRSRDVLLVDDMVDSRWTLTYLAALLRQHGVGRVYPVVLAMTTGAY